MIKKGVEIVENVHYNGTNYHTSYTSIQSLTLYIGGRTGWFSFPEGHP